MGDAQSCSEMKLIRFTKKRKQAFLETNSDDSDQEFVIEIKDREKTVVEKYSN